MDINLSERIRTARKRAGLTQTALAKRLKIALPTLNKYENNHRIPSAELLSRMAILLDCEPGWLLSGEGAGADRVAEATPGFGDPQIALIVKMLYDMDKEAKDDALRYLEAQKLWREKKLKEG